MLMCKSSFDSNGKENTSVDLLTKIVSLKTRYIQRKIQKWKKMKKMKKGRNF